MSRAVILWCKRRPDSYLGLWDVIARALLSREVCFVQLVACGVKPIPSVVKRDRHVTPFPPAFLWPTVCLKYVVSFAVPIMGWVVVAFPPDLRVLPPPTACLVDQKFGLSGLWQLIV